MVVLFPSHEPPALSDRVQRMLYHFDPLVLPDDGDILQLINTEKLLINWESPYFIKKRDYIENNVVDSPTSLEPDLESVKIASIHLRPVIEVMHPVIHETLMAANNILSIVDDVESIQYFAHYELLDECLRLYQAGEYWLCFALGITMFERAIGDLLLSSKKVSPEEISSREMKINDILTNPEMSKYLGDNVLFIIRCFTGPIQSLNARNLLWHGFLGCNDLPNSFISFLFALIVSVGALPEVRAKKNVRNSFDLRPVMDSISIPKINVSVEQMVELTANTEFIPANRLVDWQKAFSLYDSKQYFYCISLLLPLLEHSLRRLFGIVNNCEDRIHCADTDEAYTTFDEILDTIVTDKTTKVPNKLYQELGDKIMHMLFDVLFWKDGPRIRDKVAHGCLVPSNVPSSIADILVYLCVILFKKYKSPPTEEHSSDDQESIIHLYYHSYSSYFHPAKMLAEDIVQCRNELLRFYGKYVECTLPKHQIAKELGKPLVLLVPDESTCQSAIRNLQDQILMLHHTGINFDNSDSASQDLILTEIEFPSYFVGKIGNCMSVGLNSIYVLRKVVFHLREVFTITGETYSQSMTLILNRQSNKRDKMLAAKLAKNMKGIHLLSQLILSMVHLLCLEAMKEHTSESSEQLRQASLFQTVSLQASLKCNNWDKLIRNLPQFILSSSTFITASKVP